MIYPPEPCRNCRRRFQPTRKTQRFCSDACRISYHQYGSLNARKIEDIAAKILKARLKDFEARIAALETAAHS